VARIEQRYKGRPTALRRSIAGLVVLGYSVVLATLGLAASFAVFLGAVAFHTPFPANILCIVGSSVVLALVIGQAISLLWVSPPRPAARELTREEFPRLFQVLDHLQSQSRSPPLDHVWLNTEFNARVWFEPRLGLLGLSRRHLLLGFPLLLLVTPSQATAVLAHELAHHSESHNRFNVWIGRLQQTWSTVFADWGPSSGGWMQIFRRPLESFLRWFWPRFHAHAFVLSRLDEYEADRLAADWTTVVDSAMALFVIQCHGTRLSRDFWPGVHREMNRVPEPPSDVYQTLQRELAGPPDSILADRWICEALRFRTLPSDSHPSLADRLRNLEMTPETLTRHGFPLAPPLSAAEELLAPRFELLRSEMSRSWQLENARAWNIGFHNAQRLKRELAGSPPVAETEPRTDAERAECLPHFSFDQADAEWNHLSKRLDLEGFRAIEPLLRQFLERHPQHLPGWLTLGANLLTLGDEAGQIPLRRVIDGNQPHLATEAFLVWKSWLERRDDSTALARLETEIDQFQKNQRAAEEERRAVRPTDRFHAVSLEDATHLGLLQTLATQSDLESAWLAEKEMRHQPDRRLFVLIVAAKRRGWLDRTWHERSAAVAKALSAEVSLPGQTLVIPSSGGFHRLARAIREIPRSQLGVVHAAAR
jgi:Zn-dependent protease with chaperone function